MFKLSFLISILPLTLSAQLFGGGIIDSSKTPEPIQLAGIYANGGMNFCNSVTISDAQLAKLLPDFENKSYAHYTHPYYGRGNTNGSSFAEAGVSVYTNFKGKPVTNKKWKTNIGLSYGNFSFIESSFENKSSYRVDTLFNAGGTAVQYEDSVFSERVMVNYSSNCVGLNLSESYSTKPYKIFSLSVEMGVKAMYSFEQNVYEFYHTERYLGTSADPNHNYNNSTFYSNPENAKSTYDSKFNEINKHCTIGMLYGSFGTNFRLAKFKKLKSRLLLSPTISGGLQLTKIESVGSFPRVFGALYMKLSYVID